MFARMTKTMLLGAAVLAGVALFSTAPALTTSASADGDSAIKDFKKNWKGSKKEIQALGRSNIADGLPANNVDAIPALTTVLEDPLWRVRFPAVRKIMETTDQSVIDAWVEVLRKKKTALGVKESIAFGLAYRNDLDDEKSKLLRDLIKDDEMPWEVREVIARSMNRWPVRDRPMPVNINDNEKDKKKIEERNAKINARVQPQLKNNLLALYDVLKEVLNDKVAKKNKKSAAYRKLRWSTIYSMETTTSQEWGDDLKAWDIFLTQTGFDHEKGELKDLKYRWRERVSETVGNVKITGETAVRKKKRRNTNTELIMIPPLGTHTEYFFPFMEEFTHYFDVSFFKMPFAEKGAKALKRRDGSERPDAYLYPTAGVAKAFEEYRKKRGGNKNLGMFLHGGSCFIGMEFAKNNSEKAAFIIVVGGWGSNADVSKGLEQCRRSQDLDLRYYGIINRTNYETSAQHPEPFTDEKRFLGDAGNISHRFSNDFDSDQYLLPSRVRIPDNQRERVGRSPIIDTEYAFAARPACKVPALFIWGEDDPMYVKGSEKKLGKFFKSAQFVKMKGVGRLPWMEDPIAFFDHIEKFMEKKKVWERLDKIKKKKDKKRN